MLVKLTVYFSRIQADRDALIVARLVFPGWRIRKVARRHGAYKMPKPRMAPTDNFALVLSCTFHSSGMGLGGKRSAEWSYQRKAGAVRPYMRAVAQSVKILTAVVA